MTIAEKAKELTDALTGVDVPGLRVYPDVGPGVTPPGVVLGVPILDWEAQGSEPTSARWPVFLVVPRGDRALRQLWELLPPVTAALDEVVDVVVKSAAPSLYPISGGELPAYEIQVDVALGA